MDHSGRVYFADFNNNRIQKFSSTGTFIREWVTQGSGNGEFKGPSGVAVDSSNNIYVVDTANHRIQKFTRRIFITKWGQSGLGEGQYESPPVLQ